MHLGSDSGFFAIEREHDGFFQTCNILAHNKSVFVVLPLKRKANMARGRSPAFHLCSVLDNQFQQLVRSLLAGGH
jgi:hypothetical protein